jgi:hypothetical protein
LGDSVQMLYSCDSEVCRSKGLVTTHLSSMMNEESK